MHFAANWNATRLHEYQTRRIHEEHVCISTNIQHMISLSEFSNFFLFSLYKLIVRSKVQMKVKMPPKKVNNKRHSVQVPILILSTSFHFLCICKLVQDTITPIVSNYKKSDTVTPISNDVGKSIFYSRIPQENGQAIKSGE